MKVRELIEYLQIMDQEANVKIIYDGEPRLDVNVVYKSRSEDVMLTDTHEVVYSKESRPDKNEVMRGACHLTSLADLPELPNPKYLEKV